MMDVNVDEHFALFFVDLLLPLSGFLKCQPK
jgi:hypothetical protein